MPENDSGTNDPLTGLLGALLGGQPGAQDQTQNGGLPLDQILGSLISNAGATPTAGSSNSPLGDIIGGLMGGAPQGEGTSIPGAGGDPLSAMLGSLMGGGMPQAGGQGQPPQATDAMGAALGGLMGGETQGAAASPLAANSFLAPIIEAITSKIGIPPQLAGAVVSFALAQLMGGQRDPQLAQMLGGKGTVSQKYLRDSGLATQLAEQTGLDKKAAAASLQQVLQVFGTQMTGGSR